eukprot:3198813-Prymnesium_polylepis.1
MVTGYEDAAPNMARVRDARAARERGPMFRRATRTGNIDMTPCGLWLGSRLSVGGPPGDGFCWAWPR